MPGALGGVRAGPGRPRKSVKFAGQIAKAEKQIADQLPLFIAKAIELAQGIWVERETAGGKVKVYEKPPDMQAIMYLTDRIMGKPVSKTSAEVSGPNGGPVKITEIVIEHEESE